MSAYILNPETLSPPPPVGTIEYSGHTDHGSVGPVIGVLIMIFILGSASVLFSRFCSGHGRIRGREYDIENWAETKCSSCIDGGVDEPTPQPALAPAPAPAPASARVVVQNNNNNCASSSRQARAAPTPPPRVEETKEEAGEPQITQSES